MGMVHLVLELDEALKMRRTLFSNFLSKAEIFAFDIVWETGGHCLVIVDGKRPPPIL